MTPAPFSTGYWPAIQRFKRWIQALSAVWRSLSRAEQAFFLAALSAGILLRANHYGRPMLHDETFAYEVFVKPGILHALFRYDYPQHIFHSLLVYFSTIFSGSEVFIRLPAFFFSLSSLLLLFLFVRRFFGVTAALFALSLSALSYFQIDYAHNARGYSMNIFFTLLSAYGLFSIIRDPLGKNAKYWLMYAVGAVLNTYTLISSVIYLVSIAVFGLLYLFSLGPPARRVLLRDCLKYNGIVIGATFLLYLPPLVFYYFYPERTWLRAGEPAWLSQCLIFSQQMLAYLFSPFADGNHWTHLVEAQLVQEMLDQGDREFDGLRAACLAGFTVLGVLLTAREDKKKGLLLACIMATPFILTLIFRMIVYERNFLYIQPFVFISISVFLAQIQAFLKNKLSAAAVTAAIMILIGLAGHKTTYAEFTAKPNFSPKITASMLNIILRPDDAYFPCYGIDNNIRYYLTDGSKDIYMLMFEYKRNGLINAKIKNGFQKIYCVFDGEPDFKKIFRIYNLDWEILRRNYKPFTLCFQSGTVKVYLAERRTSPGKRPENKHR